MKRVINFLGSTAHKLRPLSIDKLITGQHSNGSPKQMKAVQMKNKEKMSYLKQIIQFDKAERNKIDLEN